MFNLFYKCKRYWNTIKYLKLSQLCWRLYYLFYKPRIQENNWPLLSNSTNLAIAPLERKRCYLGDGKFLFLSRVLSIQETGWNNDRYPKLWMYHMNYFDFLMQDLSDSETSDVYNLLSDWVQKNEVGKGVPWEPYPISLRIVNMIKWILLGNRVSEEIERSLVIQVRYLRKKIEWHIEGNHLLANAKALIFAGIVFEGTEAEDWEDVGSNILLKELGKQVLNDGAHFELSPMYQSIILEDVLDIVNLYSSFNQRLEDTSHLKSIASKMVEWLSYLSHPDGQISHFNDSSMDAAVGLTDLQNYANSLGVKCPKHLHAQSDLSSSGFVASRLGASSLLIDGGEIGASYQPGHAHADTSSFELCVFGQRVFVNTGVSTYEANSIRLRERGTASHNTVEINNENSSEVWASFRVGRRAKIIDKIVNFYPEKSEISLSHTGYLHLNGSPIHNRSFVHSIDYLKIVDRITGSFTTARGNLHIHPDVKKIALDKDTVNLRLDKNKSLRINFIGCTLKLNDYWFCSDFGNRREGKCIEYLIKDVEAKILIKW